MGANLLTSAMSTSINVSWSSIHGEGKIETFNVSSIIINTVFGTAAGRYSQFVGDAVHSNEFGDASASPFNAIGTVSDETTKPKENN